jgi:hypothetical protein
MWRILAPPLSLTPGPFDTLKAGSPRNPRVNPEEGEGGRAALPLSLLPACAPGGLFMMRSVACPTWRTRPRGILPRARREQAKVICRIG